MRSKILILSILLATSMSTQAQSMFYYQMIDSAEYHITQQEWPQAEHFIQSALRAEPDNPNNSLLLSNLATVQRYQGNFSEALLNYSVALYMTPNALTLLKNRASLYLDMDSIEQAFADYERVLAIDNMDLEALYNHGMLAITLDRIGTASDDFDRIDAISPKSYYALNSRATLNRVKGNYSAAVDGYTKVIKARPTVDTYISRAECYLEMGKLNDAEEDLRTAIDIQPENAYLYALRARLDRLRYDAIAYKHDTQLALQYGLSQEDLEAIIHP